MPKKILVVRVQPKSSRQELIPISETEFKARLTSAPEKGQANKELLELMADYLNLKPSRLKIIRGGTSRVKMIEIIEIDR
ncbi:MAG: DUF167 domain-containing protein [Acidobacteriota bacterium]|nr:DUF167 domain-containing protein [Acidobacteriota bacterium]MDW3228369.1 DUF167 domain-containing protein [Acidobacteriota bacterium]MDY0231964.1 DUF167 domain-containing protein [Candidatus Saccharicenans sp.]